jgi:exodeoxyribonuclease VII large subunit
LLDATTGHAVRSPAALRRERRYALHLAQGAADVSFGDVQPRLTDAF